jgi:hypothetical protein
METFLLVITLLCVIMPVVILQGQSQMSDSGFFIVQPQKESAAQERDRRQYNTEQKTSVFWNHIKLVETNISKLKKKSYAPKLRIIILIYIEIAVQIVFTPVEWCKYFHIFIIHKVMGYTLFVSYFSFYFVHIVRSHAKYFQIQSTSQQWRSKNMAWVLCLRMLH